MNYMYVLLSGCCSVFKTIRQIDYRFEVRDEDLKDIETDQLETIVANYIGILNFAEEGEKKVKEVCVK